MFVRMYVFFYITNIAGLDFKNHLERSVLNYFAGTIPYYVTTPETKMTIFYFPVAEAFSFNPIIRVMSVNICSRCCFSVLKTVKRGIFTLAALTTNSNELRVEGQCMFLTVSDAPYFSHIHYLTKMQYNEGGIFLHHFFL
jgi:hypothetical protein